MSVAIRTATRIQDQDDAPSLGAGQDGYALTWDNASGAFVATALFTGGLLATGATAGATSQAQAFTNGVIGPSWKPSADSTTALQLQNAAGTAILTVDTSNSRLGIGTASPATALNVSGVLTVTLPSATSTKAIDVVKPDATAGGMFFGSASGLAGRFYPLFKMQNQGGYGVSSTLEAQSLSTDDSGTQPIFILSARLNTGVVSNRPLFEFNNYTTVVLTVASDGDLGIGTRIPATKLHTLLTSAATNTVTNVVTIGHDTTGTAAAGFGAGQLFTLESSTTAAQSAARVQALWYEATHASRKADLVLTAFDTAEREGLRIRGDGSGPAIGFYGVSPIERATLATGAGASVDDVITALQNLGLVKQS